MKSTRVTSSARRKRDAWAELGDTGNYERRMGVYARARDEEIVARMLGGGPGRLLDMPCGTGRHLALARRLGFAVNAADFSPTMLSVVPETEGVSAVRADIFAPPFLAQTFDVILVSRLLFHYARPEDVLASLLPTLRPGGRLVFDSLNTWSTRWLASQFLRPFQRDPARRLYFEPPGRLARKLDALGLEVVENESVYLLPTRLYRFLPGGLVRVLHAAERLALPQLRVLTYWHARRRLEAAVP